MVEASAENVDQLLQVIEESHPGVRDYLVHENGKLRPHVNIFMDNRVRLLERFCAGALWWVYMTFLG